jgi:hypothetical protein
MVTIVVQKTAMVANWRYFMVRVFGMDTSAASILNSFISATIWSSRKRRAESEVPPRYW